MNVAHYVMVKGYELEFKGPVEDTSDFLIIQLLGG